MKIAIIAATAALGGLLFGYDTGVISGAILFLRGAFHLSNLMLGVVTSLALAGAALGAGVGGPLSDHYGRRPIPIATAGVFVVGGLVSAFAMSLPMLLVGRFVVGLGCVSACKLDPLIGGDRRPKLMSWRAPAHHRGSCDDGVQAVNRGHP